MEADFRWCDGFDVVLSYLALFGAIGRYFVITLALLWRYLALIVCTKWCKLLKYVPLFHDISHLRSTPRPPLHGTARRWWCGERHEGEVRGFGLGGRPRPPRGWRRSAAVP